MKPKKAFSRTQGVEAVFNKNFGFYNGFNIQNTVKFYNVLSYETSVDVRTQCHIINEDKRINIEAIAREIRIEAFTLLERYDWRSI